jgi:hypothetical protein
MLCHGCCITAAVLQGQLSCGNLDAALPHVLLLSSICREQPALLSSYVPQLKDCLCSIAGLSADAALVLLLALWPLCRCVGCLCCKALHTQC